MASDDVEARLRFNEINDDVRGALRELQPFIREALPGILDAFYAHIRSWPEVARNFADESRMKAAGGRQFEHWMRIVKADFGDDYIRSAEKIGEVHARLKLEPRWYIGAYTFISTRLIREIATSKGGHLKGGKDRTRLVEAVNKAVLFDMDIVLSTIQRHAAQARVDELRGLADRFEEQVLGVVETVAASAAEMSRSADAMATAATATERRCAAVSAAAEQATSNVSVVAASSEEMGSTIQEIAHQVSQSTRIAGDAVSRAGATQETIERLSNAAGKIGAVVSLISDIAEQTNLLALNATIESARAGEAGRGFAVVAAEVKALATQTAKATEDIGVQIKEMQGITKQSVDAISTIRSTIDEINTISVSVNAAIEEQSAATQEIARSTQEAATGTQEVSSNITDVLSDAQKTGSAASGVVKVSEQLGAQAGQLRDEVDKFLKSVRAA